MHIQKIDNTGFHGSFVCDNMKPNELSKSVRKTLQNAAEQWNVDINITKIGGNKTPLAGYFTTVTKEITGKNSQGVRKVMNEQAHDYLERSSIQDDAVSKSLYKSVVTALADLASNIKKSTGEYPEFLKNKLG